MILPWASTAIELLSLSAKPHLRSRENTALKERGLQNIDQLFERKIDGLLYTICHHNSIAQSIYDKVWELQRSEITQIVRELLRFGVTSILFKGAEHFTHRARPIGLLGDIDLLVPRNEIEKTKIVLHSLGYRQATFSVAEGGLVDTDVSEIAQLEATHYELSLFDKVTEIELDTDERDLARVWNRHPIRVIGDRCVVVNSIDVHHQVATDIESKPFFDRAKPSGLGVGLTMADEDHLWFTTSRYYTEVALHGKRSLRDFAYLAFVLGRDHINWDVVLKTTADYDLRPSLYYYLTFLDSILGRIIPEEILGDLSPNKGSRSRDWGWQLGNLFCFVEPFPLNPITDLR